jgi:hypothetical protein
VSAEGRWSSPLFSSHGAEHTAAHSLSATDAIIEDAKRRLFGKIAQCRRESHDAPASNRDDAPAADLDSCPDSEVLELPRYCFRERTGLRKTLDEHDSSAKHPSWF